MKIKKKIPLSFYEKSCLRAAFFVLGSSILDKQKSLEASKFKAFEWVYYTLARNNRELQQNPYSTAGPPYYTLARNNRELQHVIVERCICQHYTLARNNRELQQAQGKIHFLLYYTLARNNRELQLIPRFTGTFPLYIMEKDNYKLNGRNNSSDAHC